MNNGNVIANDGITGLGVEPMGLSNGVATSHPEHSSAAHDWHFSNWVHRRILPDHAYGAILVRTVLETEAHRH